MFIIGKLKKALRQLNSTEVGWKDLEMENQSWREKSGSSGSTGGGVRVREDLPGTPREMVLPACHTFNCDFIHFETGLPCLP